MAKKKAALGKKEVQVQAAPAVLERKQPRGTQHREPLQTVHAIRLARLICICTERHERTGRSW
jgi:hypothetical protein